MLIFSPGFIRAMDEFPLATLWTDLLHLTAPGANNTNLGSAPLLLVLPKLESTTAFHVNLSEAVWGLSESQSVMFEEVSFTEYHKKETNMSQAMSVGVGVGESEEVVEVPAGQGVVHIATVSRQLGIVTVLLLNEEDAPAQQYPVDIYFTVKVCER